MRACAILLLATFGLTQTAQAVTIYAISDVCGLDMQQYCKGMKPTRLRDLRACLARHERELLPRCQDHYKEAVGH